MMTIIIATRNKGKITEFTRLLAGRGFALIPAGPDLPEAPETSDRYEENAAAKALAAAAAFHQPAVSDDSGLAVAALDGAPGVRSSRFFGPGLSDREKYERLLALLDSVGDGRRAARFICAAALALPDGRYWVRRGEVEGEILRAPRGAGGFGYDPVFWVPDFACSFAELTPEQKEQVSHRGRALRALLPIIDAVANGQPPPEDRTITGS